jgi:rod shape-determining protein MreD
MLRLAIIFTVIFLAVMLQVSFFPNILIPKIFPDVALITIIFWAARSGFEKAWPWAIIAGLMLDFAYFWPVGTNVFSFALVAYGASHLSRRFLVADNFSRFFTMAAILVLVVAIHNFLAPAIVEIARRDRISLGALILNADFVFKIIYDLIIFALAYVPLARLEKFTASLDSRPKSLG